MQGVAQLGPGQQQNPFTGKPASETQQVHDKDGVAFCFTPFFGGGGGGGVFSIESLICLSVEGVLSSQEFVFQCTVEHFPPTRRV